MPGYSGNVKRHPNHVSLSNGLCHKNKIVFHDIEKANKEFGNGPNKIMEQILGPRVPPTFNSNGSHHHPGSDSLIVKLVPTVATADQDLLVEAEAVTLVHCKIVKAEEDHERFRNLCMKPVYWREFRVKKQNHDKSPKLPVPSLMNSHPLHSSWHQHLMSITLAFTSLNEGYVYHLPGHIRKPGRGLGVQRVAVCPFTSPVGQITLESPTIMHATTQTG